MKVFFETIGAFILGVAIILIGFFVLVGFYSFLLLLVYYIGYFGSYIFGFFIPQLKSIHIGGFNYHQLAGFLVMISALFSTKLDFNFFKKK